MKKREDYIDFLRSFSLIVVVIWHWCFTVLIVNPNQVSPSNPIGQTSGMWAITWMLQVMPVFFFVGGYVHLNTFSKPNFSVKKFLVSRYKRLLIPALGLSVIWLIIGVVIRSSIEGRWVTSGVVLVLSPLWFLIVYLLLATLAPLTIRFNKQLRGLDIVWMIGLAAVLDVLRFSHQQGWAAWLNFIIIWGLAHQFGYYYPELKKLGSRVGWMFAWSGLFTLIALTNIGFYPRSVVGVPGERFSNMGPPTLAIVALIVLQVGLVLIARPHAERLLSSNDKAKKLFAWLNANSLPLFLLHTSGMAIVLAIFHVAFDYRPPASPNLHWWLTRPVWIILPLIATLPLIKLFRLALRTKTDADKQLETA